MSAGAMIPLIAIGAGTAMQASSQYQAGKAQSKWLKYNAALARQEAEVARKKAAYETGQFRKQAEAFKAGQVAAIAAGGKKLAGTSLKILAETAAEMELDAAMIAYRGKEEARRFEAEARLARKQAGYVRRAARTQAMTTLLSTGGRLGFTGYEQGWWGK